MFGEYLKNIEQLSERVDAILVCNREGYVEYAATKSDESDCLSRDKFIGKHILEVYPSLSKETSSHYRALQSKEPIINEKQSLVDMFGDSYTYINSTFPIKSGKEVVGTIELSTVLSKNRKDYSTSRSSRKNEKTKLYTLDNIITQNAKMLELKKHIETLSKSDACVLIWGETGTGKELFAESFHTSGKRKDKPFVSINCSALPTNIAEGLLFGTEKGSFTGAENKKGLLELADGGTLFLDELNSMDLSLQPKILKVIEQGRMRRIGGEKEIAIDVRYIAAMNIAPEVAVMKRLLREDLYYRLNVIPIHIPPLKERKEDIDIMTHYFLDNYAKELNKSITGITDITMNLLHNHSWKGNVRELKNVIEYAVSISSDELITMNDLPQSVLYTTEIESVLNQQSKRQF